MTEEELAKTMELYSVITEIAQRIGICEILALNLSLTYTLATIVLHGPEGSRAILSNSLLLAKTKIAQESAENDKDKSE